jgi:hypothetical protein
MHSVSMSSVPPGTEARWFLIPAFVDCQERVSSIISAQRNELPPFPRYFAGCFALRVRHSRWRVVKCYSCTMCKMWSSKEDIASIHSRNRRLNCYSHLYDLNEATRHTCLQFDVSTLTVILCIVKAMDHEAKWVSRRCSHGKPRTALCINLASSMYLS